jgi:hypothetical protein
MMKLITLLRLAHRLLQLFERFWGRLSRILGAAAAANSKAARNTLASRISTLSPPLQAMRPRA